MRLTGEKNEPKRYRLSPKQKIYLFRQLSYLIGSGYSIEMSLRKILGGPDERGNKNWRNAVGCLIRTVRDYGSLARAAEELNVFGPEIIYQIKGGELSGELSGVLLSISRGFESTDNISRSIKIMMIYPAVLLSVLFGAMYVISIYIMPEILLLVSEVGAELSALSKAVIAISAFIAKNGGYLLISFMLALGGFFYALKMEKVRYFRDLLLTKTFMVRNLVRLQDLIRYCKVFAALFRSGLDLETVLDCAANGVKNQALRQRALGAKTLTVKDGMDLALALNTTGLFDSAEIQMIDIGAGVSSEKLCEAFDAMAARSTKEADAAVKSALAMMEPASFIILGLFIGIFIIGVYSPVYSVIGSM